ncbi:MAG: hypothetical protein ACM3ZQ_04835 [Bacillota bacterium]
MQIGPDILDAFGVHGEPIPLEGGQNSSVRIANVVLKPVDNGQYHEWVASTINQIKDPQGYRLSRPIISKYDCYSYRGWCCTAFEPGHHRRGEAAEKLRVARLLHHDLQTVVLGDIPYSDDPWTKAHRIAWKKDPLPSSMIEPAHDTLAGLLATVPDRSLTQKVQIVHSDLSGNVLFDDRLEPLVIDFSPTVGPAEYAEAILVCDCIAWEGSPLSDLDLLPLTPLYQEMVRRAVTFRLAVTALVAKDNRRPFDDEYRCFRPIIDRLDRTATRDS